MCTSIAVGTCCSCSIHGDRESESCLCYDFTAVCHSSSSSAKGLPSGPHRTSADSCSIKNACQTLSTLSQNVYGNTQGCTTETCRNIHCCVHSSRLGRFVNCYTAGGGHRSSNVTGCRLHSLSACCMQRSCRRFQLFNSSEEVPYKVRRRPYHSHYTASTICSLRASAPGSNVNNSSSSVQNSSRWRRNPKRRSCTVDTSSNRYDAAALRGNSHSCSRFCISTSVCSAHHTCDDHPNARSRALSQGPCPECYSGSNGTFSGMCASSKRNPFTHSGEDSSRTGEQSSDCTARYCSSKDCGFRRNTADVSLYPSSSSSIASNSSSVCPSSRRSSSGSASDSSSTSPSFSSRSKNRTRRSSTVSNKAKGSFSSNIRRLTSVVVSTQNVHGCTASMCHCCCCSSRSTRWRSARTRRSSRGWGRRSFSNEASSKPSSSGRRISDRYPHRNVTAQACMAATNNRSINYRHPHITSAPPNPPASVAALERSNDQSHSRRNAERNAGVAAANESCCRMSASVIGGIREPLVYRTWGLMKGFSSCRVHAAALREYYLSPIRSLLLLVTVCADLRRFTKHRVPVVRYTLSVTLCASPISHAACISIAGRIVTYNALNAGATAAILCECCRRCSCKTYQQSIASALQQRSSYNLHTTSVLLHQQQSRSLNTFACCKECTASSFSFSSSYHHHPSARHSSSSSWGRGLRVMMCHACAADTRPCLCAVHLAFVLICCDCVRLFEHDTERENKRARSSPLPLYNDNSWVILYCYLLAGWYPMCKSYLFFSSIAVIVASAGLCIICHFSACTSKPYENPIHATCCFASLACFYKSMWCSAIWLCMLEYSKTTHASHEHGCSSHITPECFCCAFQLSNKSLWVLSVHGAANLSSSLRCLWGISFHGVTGLSASLKGRWHVRLRKGTLCVHGQSTQRSDSPISRFALASDWWPENGRQSHAVTSCPPRSCGWWCIVALETPPPRYCSVFHREELYAFRDLSFPYSLRCPSSIGCSVEQQRGALLDNAADAPLVLKCFVDDEDTKASNNQAAENPRGIRCVASCYPLADLVPFACAAEAAAFSKTTPTSLSDATKCLPPPLVAACAARAAQQQRGLDASVFAAVRTDVLVATIATTSTERDDTTAAAVAAPAAPVKETTVISQTPPQRTSVPIVVTTACATTAAASHVISIPQVGVQFNAADGSAIKSFIPTAAAKQTACPSTAGTAAVISRCFHLGVSQKRCCRKRTTPKQRRYHQNDTSLTEVFSAFTMRPMFLETTFVSGKKGAPIVGDVFYAVVALFYIISCYLICSFAVEAPCSPLVTGATTANIFPGPGPPYVAVTMWPAAHTRVRQPTAVAAPFATTAAVILLRVFPHATASPATTFPAAAGRADTGETLPQRLAKTAASHPNAGAVVGATHRACEYTPAHDTAAATAVGPLAALLPLVAREVQATRANTGRDSLFRRRRPIFSKQSCGYSSIKSNRSTSGCFTDDSLDGLPRNRKNSVYGLCKFSCSRHVDTSASPFCVELASPCCFKLAVPGACSPKTASQQQQQQRFFTRHTLGRAHLLRQHCPVNGCPQHHEKFYMQPQQQQSQEHQRSHRWQCQQQQRQREGTMQQTSLQSRCTLCTPQFSCFLHDTAALVRDPSTGIQRPDRSSRPPSAACFLSIHRCAAMPYPRTVAASSPAAATAEALRGAIVTTAAAAGAQRPPASRVTVACRHQSPAIIATTPELRQVCLLCKRAALVAKKVDHTPTSLAFHPPCMRQENNHNDTYSTKDNNRGSATERSVSSDIRRASGNREHAGRGMSYTCTDKSSVCPTNNRTRYVFMKGSSTRSSRCWSALRRQDTPNIVQSADYTVPLLQTVPQPLHLHGCSSVSTPQTLCAHTPGHCSSNSSTNDLLHLYLEESSGRPALSSISTAVPSPLNGRDRESRTFTRRCKKSSRRTNSSSGSTQRATRDGSLCNSSTGPLSIDIPTHSHSSTMSSSHSTSESCSSTTTCKSRRKSSSDDEGSSVTQRINNNSESDNGNYHGRSSSSSAHSKTEENNSTAIDINSECISKKGEEHIGRLATQTKQGTLSAAAHLSINMWRSLQCKVRRYYGKLAAGGHTVNAILRESFLLQLSVAAACYLLHFFYVSPRLYNLPVQLLPNRSGLFQHVQGDSLAGLAAAALMLLHVQSRKQQHRRQSTAAGGAIIAKPSADAAMDVAPDTQQEPTKYPQQEAAGEQQLLLLQQGQTPQSQQPQQLHHHQQPHQHQLQQTGSGSRQLHPPHNLDLQPTELKRQELLQCIQRLAPLQQAQQGQKEVQPGKYLPSHSSPSTPLHAKESSSTLEQDHHSERMLLRQQWEKRTLHQTPHRWGTTQRSHVAALPGSTLYTNNTSLPWKGPFPSRWRSLALLASLLLSYLLSGYAAWAVDVALYFLQAANVVSVDFCMQRSLQVLLAHLAWVVAGLSLFKLLLRNFFSSGITQQPEKNEDSTQIDDKYETDNADNGVRSEGGGGHMDGNSQRRQHIEHQQTTGLKDAKNRTSANKGNNSNGCVAERVGTQYAEVEKQQKQQHMMKPRQQQKVVEQTCHTWQEGPLDKTKQKNEETGKARDEHLLLQKQHTGQHVSQSLQKQRSYLQLGDTRHIADAAVSSDSQYSREPAATRAILGSLSIPPRETHTKNYSSSSSTDNSHSNSNNNNGSNSNSDSSSNNSGRVPESRMLGSMNGGNCEEGRGTGTVSRLTHGAREQLPSNADHYYKSSSIDTSGSMKEEANNRTNTIQPDSRKHRDTSGYRGKSVRDNSSGGFRSFLSFLSPRGMLKNISHTAKEEVRTEEKTGAEAAALKLLQQHQQQEHPKVALKSHDLHAPRGVDITNAQKKSLLFQSSQPPRWFSLQWRGKGPGLWVWWAIGGYFLSCLLFNITDIFNELLLQQLETDDMPQPVRTERRLRKCTRVIKKSICTAYTTTDDTYNTRHQILRRW